MSSFLNLHTYATQSTSSDDSLAKVFHAQFHVTTNMPYWQINLGAIDHMTPTCDSLTWLILYSGKNQVIFGNGKKIPITHTGSSTISNKLPLHSILVIPNLTMNLLSIYKLTTNHPIDVQFSLPFFNVQD